MVECRPTPSGRARTVGHTPGPPARRSRRLHLRMRERPRASFLLGLFLTTLATLVLEVLDTRLLSVVTWYHLSFFAVSTAMFGMAAGALKVYLGGERFEGEGARRELARHAQRLALAIPATTAGILLVPVPLEFGTQYVAALAFLAACLALPFYLSGVVVSIALTRIPGSIGLVYAVDLLGAALGAVLLIGLLEATDGPTVAILCGALAALAAAAFEWARGRLGVLRLVTCAALLGLAWANDGAPQGLRAWWTKGKPVRPGEISREEWNIHAQVLVYKPRRLPPQFWGPGEGAERLPKVERVRMIIDGDAGTSMTAWDGRRESLDWVRFDVTSLPYHLRRGGEAAVIGVGGGRDILTALWGECRRVTGIEINRTFVDLLEGPARAFAGLAERPEVRVVHDEARSWLTRCDERFDVLQMSLVDTWAATGAGAFTLSENGLYTLESWRVFLDRLRPGGVFSVSRWYDPANASETSRLVALGVAALLDRGVTEPDRQLILVARGRVATLLTSVDPYSAEDLTRLAAACQTYGFRILAAPGQPAEDPTLRGILAARDQRELARATADPIFEYSPPTDERPYFFNMLRPAALWRVAREGGWRAVLGIEHSGGAGGVMAGNLAATRTLLALAALAFVGVLLVIFVPLARAGLPSTGVGGFLAGVGYFAAIGLGFMLAQVGFMQRLSVFLGHPVYAVVVTLFTMILLTGLGSWLSDRLPVERRSAVVLAYPSAAALALLLAAALMQPAIDATIERSLAVRASVAIALVAPPSVLLGLCFPLGMRLVRRVASDADAWMWGVNGAAGVFGGVLAVAISMWLGIGTSLMLAAGLYASLLVTAPTLARLGARRAGG